MKSGKENPNEAGNQGGVTAQELYNKIARMCCSYIECGDVCKKKDGKYDAEAERIMCVIEVLIKNVAIFAVSYEMPKNALLEWVVKIFDRFLKLREEAITEMDAEGWDEKKPKKK